MGDKPDEIILKLCPDDTGRDVLEKVNALLPGMWFEHHENGFDGVVYFRLIRSKAGEGKADE